MNNLNYAIMPNHDVVKLCHWSGIFVSQNINKKKLVQIIIKRGPQKMRVVRKIS